MHYTGITCITSNYTHPTVTSRQIVGFIRTVYAVPRRVLAAKGGITDPDQPCHSTFGPSPSSRGSQLVGLILRCLEPACRQSSHDRIRGPLDSLDRRNPHVFGSSAAPLTDEEILSWVLQCCKRELGTPSSRCFVVRIWASM